MHFTYLYVDEDAELRGLGNGASGGQARHERRQSPRRRRFAHLGEIPEDGPGELDGHLGAAGLHVLQLGAHRHLLVLLVPLQYLSDEGLVHGKELLGVLHKGVGEVPHGDERALPKLGSWQAQEDAVTVNM